MSEFITNCPHCNAKLQVAEEWVDMDATCPLCQKIFKIIKRNDKTKNNKISGAFELSSNQNEEDSFNFICPNCNSIAKLPNSLNGKIYECNACCEKCIAEPATNRLCPHCNNVIKFNATVCKYCKQIIPANGESKKYFSSDNNIAQNVSTANHITDTQLPNLGNTQSSNYGTNITIVQQNGHTAPNSLLSQNFETIQKSRTTYILLAFFCGGLGIHDFYAGYNTNGVIKLVISLCTGWLIIPLVGVGIWVIIDMCTVEADAYGVPFC